MVQLLDYQLKKGRNLQTGEEWDIKLGIECIAVHPGRWQARYLPGLSGTEPKIKFYFSVNAQLSNASGFADAQAAAKNKIDGIIQGLSL